MHYKQIIYGIVLFLNLLFVMSMFLIFSALGPSNMLLRGARLKNVPYVFGRLTFNRALFNS